MALADRQGIDPAVVEAEAREKEARERAARIRHSFPNVAETFIADKLAQERRGKRAEHDLRSVFIPVWADRPVSEITTLDVLAIINSKKRTAPHRSGALLALVKRLFCWAIDQHAYVLDGSPCDQLKVSKIIGPASPRSRRLSDTEIFAFWRAAGGWVIRLVRSSPTPPPIRIQVSGGWHGVRNDSCEE